MQKYFVATLSVLLAFVSWILFRIEQTAQFSSTKLALNSNGDNRQPCSPEIKPSIDNIENYDWIYCSSDLRPFWTSLSLTENEFTSSSSLFEATSTLGDLDQDARDERILRLTLGTSMIRFVILKTFSNSPARAWRAIAHLDIAQFHLAPEARVVSNGRASWLVISNDERAWGTGVLQENETWYELTNGRLVQVLSFPAEVEGNRQIRGQVSLVRFDGSRDRVDVLLKGSLAEQKVSFVKDPSMHQFQFDEGRSDIPESTYRDMCECGSK
jgi:hypothetical protein